MKQKNKIAKSQVWHYPSFGKIQKLPKDVNLSVCGVFYREKQNVSWPVCKRCAGLDKFVVKMKLPKVIREQSIEPPEIGG